MNFSFTLTRGDTATIGGEVTLKVDGVEAPFSITPDMTVRFAAKWHYNDADSAAVFYFASPARVTVIDGPGGVIQFSILPSDWDIAFPDPLTKSVTLVADVQIADAARNNVYTLARGTLMIDPDVTVMAP
jgi:hypothetical protein